ncbi:MAG TPA: hypothetical protein VFP98_09345, partial [Candidatus Polarisedimenticolia bacterium]|nr:hypothetical protein [Candidatus Polarisedimenticolia bacterium]
MADAGGRRPEGAGDPGDRVESLARELAQRESARRADRDRAEALAAQLHELARAAVSRFARAVRDAGAPHL